MPVLSRASTLLGLLAAVFGPSPLQAQTPQALQPAAATPPALIYPPSDPNKDIAAALTAAKQDGKHVLLDFGADWCPDCRVLGALFEDPTVAPIATANFHIVHVDVGRRDKNGAVVDRYHATSGDWIPAVVVIDANGQRVAATDDRVRLTRRTTPQQLTTILQEWAPKKHVSDVASFTERGVAVTMSIERDLSGGAWLAGRFTPTTPDTHLYGKDLPAEGLNGLGRPTRLAIVGTASADRGLTARGDLVADRPIELDCIEELATTLPIYPNGPVTLRLPVTLGTRPGHAEISVTYMGCGPNGCLAPVVDKRVVIDVPASGVR